MREPDSGDPPCTAAPPRRAFLASADAVLTRWNRDGGMAAVVAVDVDRFHRVNETWGYDVGDVVLSALRSRLRDRFRAGDVVTQIGGDFALLCTASQPASDHAVVTIGERIRNTLEEPVDVGGREVVLSGSVGIALARAGTGAEGLLREAEAVAEGVETDEQLEVLRAMGCDQVQGFRLARPMPLDELAEEVGAWR